MKFFLGLVHQGWVPCKKRLSLRNNYYKY